MLLAGFLVPALPEFGEFSSTAAYLNEVKNDLRLIQPETIILIVQSDLHNDEAISFEIADPYLGSLLELGDLGLPATYHPDFQLIDKLQRVLRQFDWPVTLNTNNQLPLQASIVLNQLLADKNPVLKILPVLIGTASAKEHYHIGQILREVCDQIARKVVVVAVGNLPGFGLAISEEIVTKLKGGNVTGLLTAANNRTDETTAAIDRTIGFLLGLMDGWQIKGEVLSYEGSSQLAYLIARFSPDK